MKKLKGGKWWKKFIITIFQIFQNLVDIAQIIKMLFVIVY
jgi:hypothetical protein